MSPVTISPVTGPPSTPAVEETPGEDPSWPLILLMFLGGALALMLCGLITYALVGRKRKVNIKEIKEAFDAQDMSMVDVRYDPMRGVLESGSGDSERRGSGVEGETPKVGPCFKAAQDDVEAGKGEEDFFGGYTGGTLIQVTCVPRSPKEPTERKGERKYRTITL